MFEAYFAKVAFVAVKRAVVYMVLDVGHGNLGLVIARGADLDIAGPASVSFAILAATARKKLGSVGMGKNLRDPVEGFLLHRNQVECSDVSIFAACIRACVSI